MPQLAFTDLSIRALKSNGAQVDYWDTKTPGFGIRVGKRSKTFIVKVNNRRITIGAYGPALSLSEARRSAFALKSNVDTAPVAKATFSEALTKFFQLHTPTLKGRSRTEVERLLKSHLLPDLKTKALAKITYEDVARMIERIKAPSTAWHLFKDARTFFNWCVPRYLKHSPMTGMKSPYRYVPRKRVLDDVELLTVWRAAERVGYPFGTILKLLILTGQRWGEIASLRWEYIDDKKHTITLPDTKNGTEHCFPYGQMVADILGMILRRNSSTLLFEGRVQDTPWNGSGKSKWLLDKECNIAPWQILDLRRTFGTRLAELGVPPHIVERLLNHKLGSLQTAGVITAVAAVYNRALYLPEMREAIALWEKHLAALLAAPTVARAA